MIDRTNPLLKFIVGSGLLLVVLSLYLVNQQYTLRSLFVEYERTLSQTYSLVEQEAELKMKINRVSLLTNISENAQTLGLVPSHAKNTVIVSDKRSVENR